MYYSSRYKCNRYSDAFSKKIPLYHPFIPSFFYLLFQHFLQYMPEFDKVGVVYVGEYDDHEKAEGDEGDVASVKRALARLSNIFHLLHPEQKNLE